MSVSNDSPAFVTTCNERTLLPSTFTDFCAKVRCNDPSILPEPSEPFRIRSLIEKEGIELADALLENINVTYLELETTMHTKSSAEAMAKYIRTSKHLQRIQWDVELEGDDRELRRCEEILCCFLDAIQESTSLKELEISLTPTGGLSNLALANMLTHTQSLRSLSLLYPDGILEECAVAEVSSGLRKNTTLRELKLTLEISEGAMTSSPLLTSVRDHPLLQRLCLRGYVGNLTGLDTLLLNDNSKITELEIHRLYGGPRIVGLTPVLQALARCPTLTLALRSVHLGRDEARLLRIALCNTPSLESLVLENNTLGSVGLAELAPALYNNTSIKELDLTWNDFNDMDSVRFLCDILRRNKTITILNLSENQFGRTMGAVDCIADGLGSNSMLRKINLSNCCLRDDGVSTLAQTLGSRNTTLHKLILCWNAITSTGVGVLLEAMERCPHITDLDLRDNPIRNEGSSLLARILCKNSLPSLTRLSLSRCDIGDDGFLALVSALEQNTSLLHLELRNIGFSERFFLALAESLPEIKVLQRLDLSWCASLASAMSFLLAGLRNNTSLFRFHAAGSATLSVPPTAEATARCSGGWVQEMDNFGYRNRFLYMIRVPKERLLPRGIWPHALSRVATLPDAIFELLRSKSQLGVL
jgi:Ran GTPase-activating protein (RanGAP) involved in mRNA processing and transport